VSPAAPRPGSGGSDARLVLSAEALDGALELLFLADAALWAEAEPALAAAKPELGPKLGLKLGRGHYRIAFLIKRRPGIGVQELARLTGLSKQGASRVLGELEQAGLVDKAAGELDARRRPARLTPAGAAFEAGVGERLRAQLARAYRTGGLDAAPGARRIWAALAGSRAPRASATGTGREGNGA